MDDDESETAPDAAAPGGSTTDAPHYPKTLAPVPDTHPDHSVVLTARPTSGAEETAVAGDLVETDYDAQADLALAGQAEASPNDGFAPFAGSADIPDAAPAYDVDRDTAP